MYVHKCEMCNNVFEHERKNIRFCSKVCSGKNSANLRKQNLLGMIFGRLEVKEYLGVVGLKRIWKCVCICGKIVNVSTDRLNSGHTKSCGCLSREITGDLRRKKSGEGSFNALFSKYKYNAKKRGFCFNLSKETFKKLTSSNCCYCNSEPSNGNYNYKGRHGDYIFNGIDRLNNFEGYTEENCVTCCQICNLMKRTLTQNSFLDHIEKIHAHQMSKNS